MQEDQQPCSCCYYCHVNCVHYSTSAYRSHYCYCYFNSIYHDDLWMFPVTDAAIITTSNSLDTNPIQRISSLHSQHPHRAHPCQLPYASVDEYAFVPPLLLETLNPSNLIVSFISTATHYCCYCSSSSCPSTSEVLPATNDDTLSSNHYYSGYS